MLHRKIILGFVAVCLLAVLFVNRSLSQPAERGQRGGGRGTQPAKRQEGQPQRPQGQRMDPEQMQKMMNERIKETLGVSEEKWNAIQPKVMKVLTLSRQTRGTSGMGMLFRAREERGGQAQAREEKGERAQAREERGGRAQGRQGRREQTELEKSTTELRTTLENKQASAEEIKEKLAALRKAQENARQELAKAQQELRGELTMRQEAQLVLMGLLD